MPKTATLFLSGIIMPEAWNWFGDPIISLSGVQAQVTAAGEFEDILLDIDTDGGVIEEGWRCYDYLKSLGVPINTRSGGVVASMGTILFGLGAERTLSPHGKLIFHQPSGGLEGNINDFKEYLEGLEAEQSRLIDVYVGMTGKADTEIAELLADGKDHEFNAQASIDYGWATGFYEAAAKPATARSRRMPITAHLSEGRKGLGLPERQTPESKLNQPNTIDMTKLTKRAEAAWNSLMASIQGKPMVNLRVNSADGKEYDIESTGDTYVVGDPIKYDDGTDVPDGDIILSDGNTITVAGGTITAISEPEEDEVENEQPTAQVVADETVTITKAEHDRLLSLDTQMTAMQTKHDSFERRISAVLGLKESADPVAQKLPETPEDKRNKTSEDPVMALVKERQQARNKK